MNLKDMFFDRKGNVWKRKIQCPFGLEILLINLN